MRLPVGTIYNVLVPVGGPGAVGVEGGSARGAVTAADMQRAAVQSPDSAPVMSSGPTAGTYAALQTVPYASSLPSVQSAPVVLPPTITVNAKPSATESAHDKALREATTRNVSAGMAPDAALQKANTDLATFYGKLTSATEDQRQQFYAMSNKLAADESAANQVKHQKAVDDATAKNIANGMAPDAARTKAVADITRFYAALQQASPQEVAQFNAFAQGAAQAEVAQKTAAEAAKKLEADTLKNQARSLVRDRRVAMPVTRAGRTNIFRR